jgi:metal-responsive CopG/Arc/MetJ family transcriptional regulator
MKTAISIPNDVFEGAESLAQRLRISRSQLYSRALSEYVSRHAPDSVTESYDRVCAELGEEAKADPFVSAAARRILERTEW